MKDIDIDEKQFVKIEAIIQSMTPKERANPDLLDMKRKMRIAKGSGNSIDKVNAFIKQFDQMKKMMKQMQNFTPGKR
jgi:signal recognition particle subunit SRP54